MTEIAVEIETFEAKFSYNGIKTVEIYGLKYKPKLGDIAGISVNTKFPETGKFSCSNDAFNELNKILVHTMKNYVVHIPNDPVREKAGWTQDVETAFDAYAYAFDCPEMYIKWQRDFLDINLDLVARSSFTAQGFSSVSARTIASSIKCIA